MVAVLSEHQLKRLAKHKYSTSCSTFLDPYLQVWWCWFVKWLPLWIAPNTITVVGLLVNLCTTLVLVYFSPQARAEVSLAALYLTQLYRGYFETLKSVVDGMQCLAVAL